MATLLDVIYDVRLRADDLGGDTGTPSTGYTYYFEEDDRGALFKNIELVRFLNAAHREIAVRTRCYRDTDSGLCQIRVSAGAAIYEYDPLILSTEEVLLKSTGQPLRKIQLRDLRPLQANYETTGTPTHYLEENAPFRLMLHPTPAVADTLYLTVYRLPMDEWTWAQRKTQIYEPPDQLREALIQGALMYAYQKRDADTGDGGRQAFHANEFEKLVGPAVDFRTLEDRRWNANLDTTITPSPYTVRRRSRRVGWDS
jgi:hypothetical protein